MAERPAKRQRRSSAFQSDKASETDAPKLPLRTNTIKSTSQLELTDDNGSDLVLSPTRPNKAKAIVSSKSIPQKSSPKSSPEKNRKSTRIKVEPIKIKSLHTFFPKASEEQRWHRKSATPEVEEIEDGDFGDPIEDDNISLHTSSFASTDTKASVTAHSKSKPLLVRRKSLLSGTNTDAFPPASSQRFARPVNLPKNSTAQAVIQANDEQTYHLPWSDRYGPSNLDELAVHKKKVADVQKWLENVLAGRDRQRLLILKGPAGSGKSTTISLLARGTRFAPVFWKNPVSSDASTSGSILLQFDQFLSRGGDFGGLSFVNKGSPVLSSDVDSERRVLVLEEFPTTLSRFSSTLYSYRSVLLQFLSRQTSASTAIHAPQKSSTVNPLVMVISETLLSSSTAFSDSFTAHRLLGPEILNHPLVTVMEFNPVAPTFVSKALELVIKKEARDSKRRRTPGPALLQKLADMGDIRSAINSLEFLCVRGDSSGDWSGTVAAKAKKNGKDLATLTETERNSLELISQRETTLDMFHAAGKIVYNKREDPRVQDTRAQPPPKPPDHLMHLYTPKVSQVDIEALLAETGTDIQTFISTLYENYVLSCNGDSFMDTFDGCAEILSISDVLNPDSRRTRRSKNNNAAISNSNMQAGTSDTLRQDEISFQTATRGLLFNLPYPVNRAAPASGRKADSFKMFYPASLRLWKPMEEIDSLISLFMYDNAPLAPHSKINNSGSEGVASWQSQRTNFNARRPAADTAANNDNDDEEIEEPIKLPTTHDCLATEILPYLTKINSARKKDVSLLSRITQFHGMHIPTGDEPSEGEEEEDLAAVGVAMPPPAPRRKDLHVDGSGAVPVFGSRSFGQRAPPGNGNVKDDKQQELEMEKLYISDDDIQDD